MKWKGDKIQHYQKGYNWGRRWSVFGFLAIVVGAGLKEARDALSKDHKSEWNDYRASVIGAWEGMLGKDERIF